MAFRQASNFVLNNPTFVDASTSGGLRTLSEYVAYGASHDSKDQYDAPKCHPDTRRQLLSDVHEWIKIPDKETGIMFLHGPAGVGKSCIARSVSEEAAAEGLLGASFFFWRSASDRNGVQKLFTTIAYQLAMANEDLAKHIIAEVERNPRLVHDAPLELQFRKLIFEPCLAMSRKELRITTIVIDGLDECIDPMMQVGVLQLLAKTVRYEGFPLGFFITSRPESHIQEAFITKEVIFAMQSISLDRIAAVSQDIRTVLQSGFSRILNDPKFRMALRSVPRPWPSPESLEKLVQRSSKQFIYSATVMKFISNPNRNPDAQLQIVLGIKDSDQMSPLADLDRLYHEILSRVQDTERTKKVLGYVMALKRPVKDKLLADAITKAINYNQHRLLLVVEQLLGLPEGEAYFALNQLHSVIALKVGSESFRRKSEIKFHHRSFNDFLVNKKRSAYFYMDLAEVHIDVARSCLKIMSLSKYETEEHHVGWIYAYFLWDIHAGKKKACIYLPTFDVAIKRYTAEFLQFLNLTLLKQAFEVLGLEDGSLNATNAKTIKHLTFRGSLADEEHASLIGRAIRNIKDDAVYDYVEISLRFPMIQKHLKSYNNDSMVKLMLPLCVTLGREGFPDILLRDVELGSIPPKLINYVTRIHPTALQTFLSRRRYSGKYHLTRNDYADAYPRLFSLKTWPFGDTAIQLSLVDVWAISLKNLNPTATPALMESLKSEALSIDRNLGGYITKPVFRNNVAIGRHLLTWLEQLPNPPKDVIEIWETVVLGKVNAKIFREPSPGTGSTGP